MMARVHEVWLEVTHEVRILVDADDLSFAVGKVLGECQREELLVVNKKYPGDVRISKVHYHPVMVSEGSREGK